MKVEKILIPTDFSENSHKAVTASNIFINLFDCEVDLIHVVPISSYLGESMSNLGIPININNDVYPKIVENANKKLLSFAEEHFATGKVKNLFLPVDRKPHSAIIDRAKEGNYDMIIMGAKGADSTNFLHGSVTEKVIKYSEIPVLALDNHIHNGKIKTILVPTDLSFFSLEVVSTAFELANSLGATITFFNVLELFISDYSHLPMSGVDPSINFNVVDEEQKYEQFCTSLEAFFQNNSKDGLTLKRNVEPFLDEIVKTEGVNSTSVFVRTVIKQGITAHDEIIEYANKHADLIIMATHGRSGLERMLLGSTTEHIVQHLEMPMLTIKPKLKEPN